MAAPLTTAQWKAALKAEGVRAEYLAGWSTYGRDDETGKPFGPVHGIVIHHTAGRNDMGVVVNGTSTLPGPLAHAWLGRTGTTPLKQISVHRCNHAGSVPANIKAAMIAESGHPKPTGAETEDGNDFTYGLEIENKGDGSDVYPEDQYDQAVRWTAAVIRAHRAKDDDWSAGSVFGHKEVTTRKVDPKGPVAGYGTRGRFEFTMSQFRTDVEQRLAHPASWSPPQTTTPPLPAETIESRLRDLEKWARTKGFTG